MSYTKDSTLVPLGFPSYFSCAFFCVHAVMHRVEFTFALHVFWRFPAVVSLVYIQYINNPIELGLHHVTVQVPRVVYGSITLPFRRFALTFTRMRKKAEGQRNISTTHA